MSIDWAALTPHFDRQEIVLLVLSLILSRTAYNWGRETGQQDPPQVSR